MKPKTYQVKIKDKCKQLKCNQGDINSLIIKPINENEDNFETIKKEYEKYNNEKFGCLMLSLNHIKELKEKIKEILKDVEKEDIKEIENFSHVTILYGIHHTKENIQKLKKLLEKYSKSNIELKLTKTSFFKNDDQYVLKISVESEQLNQFNQELKKELDYTTNFPKYIPHLTIAYLTPDESKYNDLENKIIDLSLESRIFVYGFNDKQYKYNNKIVLYTGLAWKHHIADDFENGNIPTKPNGAAKGGTIFVDYKKMLEYLKSDGRRWYVAELKLENEPLIFNFNNKYMATIQRNCLSEDGFKPFEIVNIKPNTRLLTRKDLSDFYEKHKDKK